MKIIRNLFLGLCLAFGCHITLAEFELLDQVVAVVDNDVITQSDIDRKVAIAKQNLQAQGTALPPDEVIYQEVLDRLILESLQLQLATRAGIVISDEQLTQSMTNIAQRNGMTLPEFKEQLDLEGVSYESMREQVRKDIMIQQVQQGHLRSKIQISEEEVANFLSSAEGQKLTATYYHLAHIILPVPESSSAEDDQTAKAQMEKIRQDLINGKLDFGKLVAGQVIAGYKISGGDLGKRSESELPSLFASAAASLAKGELSQPIRSGAGWHIVFMMDKRGGSNIVHQHRVRHILIAPSEVRTEEHALELILELRQRVIDGEDFALLAKEYSEDNGSKLQGGDLGWSRPGQFVPAFEQTMLNLAVGEVSEVFQSPFGWHFMEKMEERDHDVTQEMWKNKAYQILYERAFQSQLEIWLAEIREESYVEIK